MQHDLRLPTSQEGEPNEAEHLQLTYDAYTNSEGFAILHDFATRTAEERASFSHHLQSFQHKQSSVADLARAYEDKILAVPTYSRLRTDKFTRTAKELGLQLRRARTNLATHLNVLECVAENYFLELTDDVVRTLGSRVVKIYGLSFSPADGYLWTPTPRNRAVILSSRPASRKHYQKEVANSGKVETLKDPPRTANVAELLGVLRTLDLICQY